MTATPHRPDLAFVLAFALAFSLAAGLGSGPAPGARAETSFTLGGLSADTIPPDTLPAGPHARARLLSETGGIVPGSVNWLALEFRIDDEWNLYWKGRSDSGYPPSLTLQAPAGFEVGELLWPAPERHLSPGDILDHIYVGEVALLLPVRAPADLEPGRMITFAGRTDWLACRNLCIPESMRVELTLPVVAANAEPAGFDPRAVDPDAARAVAAAFTRSRDRLPRPWTEADPPITYVWHGEELQLQAPRASGLSFFPAEDCSILSHPLHDTVADGARLTLRFSPEEAAPLRARGVLEVRGTGTAPRWYALVAAAPAHSKERSRSTPETP
jgi:thiol:disulfide interchange protein DsbD